MIPTDSEVRAYLRLKQIEIGKILGRNPQIDISSYGRRDSARVSGGGRTFTAETMEEAMELALHAPAITAADLRAQAANLIAEADKIDPPRRREPLDARACKDG